MTYLSHPQVLVWFVFLGRRRRCLSSLWRPLSPPSTTSLRNSEQQHRTTKPISSSSWLTALSWCPDCVRAEPVIYKKLEAAPVDVALLKAYVGDKPTWRTPQYPWRLDSRFKITGVPTLVHWGNDAVNGGLEDYEDRRTFFWELSFMSI